MWIIQLLLSLLQGDGKRPEREMRAMAWLVLGALVVLAGALIILLAIAVRS